MATLRAVFVLEDRASGTMARIAERARQLDNRLERMDKRLQSVDRTHGKLADNWEKRSARMLHANRAVHNDISEISTRLTNMTRRRHVIVLDADTDRARRKIREVQRMAGQTQTMRMGATGGGGRSGFARAVGAGGVGGFAAARGGSRGGLSARALSGTANALNSLGNAFDRVGINVGPLSSRLSTLPFLLAAIGPPVVMAIAAGLSVLSGAIAGVGAAAFAAGGLMAAFVVGVSSIAIPAVVAVKRIKEKNKEIAKSKKALDRANEALGRTNKMTKDGAEITQSYKNAVDRRNKALSEYNKALAKLSPSERAATKNYGALVEAWDRLVMNGPSGERALRMVNNALVFARQQLPVVAHWMNEFSAVAENLFERMIKNGPKFRKTLLDATSTWPARFDDMGRATGHFTMGLLGMLKAAQPLMKWMSKKILELTGRFNEWANSAMGQKSMRKFFADMIPIIEAVGKLFWDFGAAIINVAQRDADDIVYFIGELSGILQKLPAYIDMMTDAFRVMWPHIRDIGGLMFRTFGILAPWITNAVEAIGHFTDALARMSDTQLKLLIGASALLLTKPGRKVVWGAIATAFRSIARSAVIIEATGVVGGMVGGRRGGKSSMYLYPDFDGGRRAPGRGTGGLAGAVGGAGSLGMQSSRLQAARGFGATAAAGAGVSALGGGGAAGAGGMSALAATGIGAAVIALAGAAAYAWETNTLKIKKHVAGMWEAIKFQWSKIGDSVNHMLEMMGMKSGTLEEKWGKIWPIIKKVFGYLGSGVILVVTGAVLGLSLVIRGVAKAFELAVGGAKLLFSVITGDIEGVKNAIFDLGEALGFDWGKKKGGGGNYQAVVGNNNVGGIPTGGWNPGDAAPGTFQEDLDNGVGGFSGLNNDLMGDGFGINLPSNPLKKLKGKGTVGAIVKHGLTRLWDFAKNKATSLGSKAAGAVGGLLPGVSAAAQALAQRFGLQISSGFRPGAVTEFGNASLHAMGRAVDFAGNPDAMQSLFNFLLGKPGIKELIYNGKASYNGGSPVAFTGSDKHTDHVHVGYGDGVGVKSAKQGAGVIVNFTGDIIIKDGSSYAEFAERITEEIEVAMAGLTDESAGEMVG